jgi:pSer/pThr/pTyr-binding forkhead associated (FHA) protein
MAKLFVTQSGNSDEETIECGPATLTIGRAPENELTLLAKKISRNHANIMYENNEYFLIDLNSGNGTKLNGILINPNEKTILRHSDIISISDFNLRFHMIDDLLNQSFNDVTDSDILEVKLLKRVLHTLDQDKIPSLEVLDGIAENKKVFLNDDTPEIYVGREPHSGLAIEEYVVSRQHAKIFHKGGGIVIRDMDSKNGTYVNGVKITEEILHDGDRISFGTIAVLFRNPKEVN